MSWQEISEARVVKSDSLFQLQRVATRDGARFLTKFAVCDLQGVEDVLLENEFRTFEMLDPRYVLAPLALDRGDKLTARYTDFVGSSLPSTMAGVSWKSPAFVDIVRGMCAALAEFHQKRLILGGIGPHSFLRDPRAERIVVADAPFAHDTQSPPEPRQEYFLHTPYVAYAAPELVGRTSLPLDSRADLYSLGAILYELLCRRPPFENADAAELVHCHLAKLPRGLREHDPSLPQGIADLVMRLLAKSPLDRFESVESFEEGFLAQLAVAPGTSRIASDSPQSGRVRTPRLSTKLYGLDAATSNVREKLSRTRTAAMIVFIEGEAGVGKTSFLLRARTLMAHGYFCRGRFLHTNPVAPLSGWASVLRDLAMVLLTKDAAETNVWRRKIRSELGEGAALISALVPEWAAILGAPARTSDTVEDGTLNRLAVAIHSLLRCYAEADMPVVLALDDLQWADTSSLKILELVLQFPEPINLLILGAVRRSPDASAADLPALQARLESSRVAFDRVRLECWRQEEIQEFLHDTLGGADLQRSEALVQFLLTRTHGNPFFVQEFLRVLINDGVLTFDIRNGSWSWRQELASLLPPAANVVEFLARKIVGLPAELQQTLRTAACMGMTFRPFELAAVLGVSLDVAASRVEAAIAEELLLLRSAGEADPRGFGPRTSGFYEFAHDRVLEACRGLLTHAEREALCLEIGRKLLPLHPADVTAETAHQLADYFNTARRMISTDEDRELCVRLNLKASNFAKNSGAFSQALDYFQAGLDFLGSMGQAKEGGPSSYERGWLQCPDLSLQLFEAGAEAALLNRRLDLAHELCDAILAHTQTPLQKARTYEIRIGCFNAEKRFPEAVAVACEVLAELGLRLPRNPTILHIVAAYVATKRRLFGKPVERIPELAGNHTAEVRAQSRIVQAMYSSAYFGHKTLFPLLVCRHIDASLRNGNDDYSCVTYIAFAIVLCARGEFRSAARLGAVVLELMKRLGAERHTAKVFLGQYAFVFPWTHHLRDSVPYLMEGFQAGLQHGDFEYAAHLVTTHSLARLHCGYSLADLAPEFERQRARIASLGQERSIILEELFSQIVHDLREVSLDTPPLGGPFYVGAQMLPRCLEPLDQNLAFHHFMAEMMLNLFRGDRVAALEAARRARAFFEGGAFGFYVRGIFVFWESLLFAWSARTGEKGRSRALRRAARGCQQLKRWAESAPMNFLHKYHLAKAEQYRARGRSSRAAHHYERAIELAQAHGYVQDVALSHECAAEFYLERGMERLGRQCLREAYVSYRRWGAIAAARRLERAYPQHFAMLVSGAGEQETAPIVSLSDSLDYRALLASSQALSGEVQLPSLLARLLRTMFEHAGAQRALLVLERRGDLYVEVEADVDRGSVEFLREERAEVSERLCRSVVRYVSRTAMPVALADAVQDERFSDDAYVQERRPRSILCVPVVHQGKLLGVAYLENNRVTHVFNAARLEIANLLAGQAAISIASARLHALELEAEQAKINPHFLFNALSSIAELAIEDGRRAEDAIVKLAQLYRYILTTSAERPVTLGQELEVVRNYLALEKLRLGSKLDFVVTCDESVVDVRVPGLLIQPLAENSIRHGISPKLSRGCVWVHASRVSERCHIIVRDDGDGLNHGTSGTGFGLRSVQERLGLVFGRDYSMAIGRRGGYSVELDLPLSGPTEPAGVAVFGDGRTRGMSSPGFGTSSPQTTLRRVVADSRKAGS